MVDESETLRDVEAGDGALGGLRLGRSVMIWRAMVLDLPKRHAGRRGGISTYSLKVSRQRIKINQLSRYMSCIRPTLNCAGQAAEPTFPDRWPGLRR
jgi:hypothetical protein